MRTRMTLALGVLPLLLLAGSVDAQSPANPRATPAPVPLDPNAQAGANYPAGGYAPGPANHAQQPQKSRWRQFCDRVWGHCDCQATHNEYGCGSFKADCVFVFGSCRAFWGEQCRQPPPRAYDYWPGVFKP